MAWLWTSGLPDCCPPCSVKITTLFSLLTWVNESAGGWLYHLQAFGTKEYSLPFVIQTSRENAGQHKVSPTTMEVSL
jgi:hypothetical protein